MFLCEIWARKENQLLVLAMEVKRKLKRSKKVIVLSEKIDVLDKLKVVLQIQGSWWLVNVATVLM